MSARIAGDGLLVIEEVMVAFDDVTRIRWRRAPTGWMLRDPWPDADERRAVQTHLDSGGTLLVLTNDDPIRAEALVDELPTKHRDQQPTYELIEVSVDHFDWLPDDVRARGEKFVAEQKRYWATRPSLLRPPIALDSVDPFWDIRLPGHTFFAVLAPGTTSGRVQRELHPFLTYLRSYESAEERGPR
ncbi:MULTISPECIES: hypothetical protein [unclassified Rathayibacter]|uniref:hypothetical protein n=1 Tax=unclassified Rathayibacter TaxID=2609250 RepID=UPI00188C3394|nr:MULTISPECIES: hypothetical protein [unclassified Rathayibacter]MBF4461749.1 hypothetical protein [Rathayibacter sp. VKM Ac-2879]MBF4503160.1 hypothetical protein [Rathayibacter sp. VKM Ac-2878]